MDTASHRPTQTDWLQAAPTLQRIEAKSHQENFPVALAILPRTVRRQLRALYGFARLVDDVGDEAPGDRTLLLDAIDDDLDRLVGTEKPRLTVLAELAPTVRECQLPLDPFHRLVEANRVDQRVRRYATYHQLLDYCTLSANPVGHLVLGVFGVATPERIRLSDRVCTALQLVEHWQDVAEDLHDKDRIYLPAEDLERFGVTEDDLAADHASEPVRRLMAFEVARAQALLTRGSALVATLRGPARLAIAGFVGGGQATLDAIAAANLDVLAQQPHASKARMLQSAFALLRRRSL